MSRTLTFSRHLQSLQVPFLCPGMDGMPEMSGTFFRRCPGMDGMPEMSGTFFRRCPGMDGMPEMSGTFFRRCPGMDGMPEMPGTFFRRCPGTDGRMRMSADTAYGSSLITMGRKYPQGFMRPCSDGSKHNLYF